MIADHDYTRKLAAIVMADVVGYSRLMGAHEEQTHARLAAYRRETLEPAILHHRGRLVSTSGDGFLIDFSSVVDAVRFSLSVQAALADRERERGADERLRLRLGVNVGDVIVDGGDIFGEGVNVAARLESLAEPGTIYVSREVRDQVVGKLPVAFEDVGRVRVKNIARPIHVYKIDPSRADAANEDAADHYRIEADSAASGFDRRPAIAVLPFENLSGDAAQEYFVDGLTDDVVVGLSCWRWFPVISSNSTRAYKARDAAVSRVGAELGASYVLQGSVRRAGRTTRISCQLLEAATGRAIWAEQYERSDEDLLLVQQEIAHAIVATIEPELDQAENRRVCQKPAERLDSWELVRRGNAHLNRLTREDSEIALRLYRQALQIDPSSVEALTQLGWWHFWWYWTQRGPREWLVDVSRYARRAMSVDQRDCRAQMLIGVYHMMRAEYGVARASFNVALRLNPSLATAHSSLGTIGYLTGAYDEAVASINTALRLSPYDPYVFHWLGEMAATYYFAGDWEKASEFASRSMKLRPAYFYAHLIWIGSLARLGRAEAAAEALDEFKERCPDFSPEHVRWLTFMGEAEREHLMEGVCMAAGVPVDSVENFQDAVWLA